jgi:hypothetical protein
MNITNLTTINDGLIALRNNHSSFINKLEAYFSCSYSGGINNIKLFYLIIFTAFCLAILLLGAVFLLLKFCLIKKNRDHNENQIETNSKSQVLSKQNLDDKDDVVIFDLRNETRK